MTLVVDASMALQRFLQEPGSQPAAMLLDGTELPVAPELILAEVRNAGWKAVRRGMATPDQLEIAAARLPVVFDELVPQAKLTVDAVAIALALDHPVYACCYLAAAKQFGTRLVTAYRRLLQRVAGTRCQHLAVALAEPD